MNSDAPARPAMVTDEVKAEVASAIYVALFDADSDGNDCGPLISKRHACIAAEAALAALTNQETGR